MIFLVESTTERGGEILLRRIKEQYESGSDICRSIPESVPRRRGATHEYWFDDLPTPEDCRDIALLVVRDVKQKNDPFYEKTLTERIKMLKNLYKALDVAVPIWDYNLNAYKYPYTFVRELDSIWFCQGPDKEDGLFVQFANDTSRHRDRHWWFYATIPEWEVSDLTYQS